MAPLLAEHPDRLIPLEAVHNFRDLGGYPTLDGRTTRWRTLYRADGLYRATTDDLDRLRPLGLRTVLDLRTHDELDQRGRFPVDQHPVDYHHVAILDTTWQVSDAPSFDDDVAFLVWAYRDMLDQGAPRFAEAFARLAAPGALPAVFHCAAGKDRTGVLAALLLSTLGVDRDLVVADYALTAEGMQRMLAWMAREAPEFAERMAEVPSGMLAAAPEAMHTVLDELDARHGSVAEFVRHIGVDAHTVAALTDALLV